MAVYERNYRPYIGALTPQNTRFLVIPRYASREILGKRLFIAFFVGCFIWPALLAIMIYLPHNVSFLKLIGQQMNLAGQEPFFFKFDASFFMYGFMVPQGWWSLFLAFIVGPELISADLRNNALPLYLSRPFSRTEYVLGKITLMVVLMSLVTWIPGLLLFGLQAYLTGGGWLTEHLRIGVGIFLGSWIYIAVLCLISLALSAYVKWKPMARMGLFAVFVVAAGLSGILNLLLETYWASLINVSDMIRVVWSRLFGIEAFSDVPTGAAWISLLAVCAACVALLARKVRAFEVVR